MSCPNCGSWAVKADRSLAGRMVCGRCGAPLGGQVIPMRRRRSVRRWRGAIDPRRRWSLALMALVAISALLAAFEAGRAPTLLPRERTPLPQGWR